MDNLTHSLAGWALGQAGLKRKTRKGLAALILGANMPDIDVFFGWVPWVPLATHRGFTHGIVGVLVMPPLLAGLLWGLDRWQQRRGAVFESGLAMHFGWLLALSYLGTFTHPLLDWQTTYSVQLMAPFNARWYHADTLFIIDAWVIMILVTGIALSRRREAAGGAWRRPAVAALAGVLTYIGGNSLLTGLAKNALLLDEPYVAADAVYASPPPLLFWQRELAWRHGSAMAWGNYDPFVRVASLNDYTAPVGTGMADPRVRTALRAVPTFARWSTMPFAAVERAPCRTVVTIADARYGRTLASSRFSRRVTMPSGAPRC